MWWAIRVATECVLAQPGAMALGMWLAGAKAELCQNSRPALSGHYLLLMCSDTSSSVSDF